MAIHGRACSHRSGSAPSGRLRGFAWTAKRLALLTLLSGAAPLAAQGMDGGMAVPRRTLVAGGTATQERWDRYWEGTLRRGNENIGAVTTRSVALTAGYGVTDRLSVAAMLPWVATRASRGTLR